MSADSFTAQVDQYLRDPKDFPPEYLWWLRRLIEDMIPPDIDEPGTAPLAPFFDEVAALAATRDLLGYWRLGDGASPFLDTSDAVVGPNNMAKTTTGTAMTDSVTGALPTADDDGAIQFNAVSGASGDYLSATDSAFAITTGTAALWVYPSGSYTGTQYIFGTYDTLNGGWAIGMSGAGRQVFFQRSDAGGNVTATGPALPNNKWTFVSVDWSAGVGVNIYLDGVLIYTDVVVQGILVSATTLRIGRSAGTANSFQGAVDEASVWGDRLSAAEHAALAASGGLSQDTSLRALLNVTGAYTATSADDIILANGTFTVSLLTAVGNSGLDLTVKNIGSGTITVDPAGSETIDGSATKTLAANDACAIVSDGTNWQLIGVYP